LSPDQLISGFDAERGGSTFRRTSDIARSMPWYESSLRRNRGREAFYNTTNPRHETFQYTKPLTFPDTAGEVRLQNSAQLMDVRRKILTNLIANRVRTG